MNSITHLRSSSSSRPPLGGLVSLHPRPLVVVVLDLICADTNRSSVLRSASLMSLGLTFSSYRTPQHPFMGPSLEPQGQGHTANISRPRYSTLVSSSPSVHYIWSLRPLPLCCRGMQTATEHWVLSRLCDTSRNQKCKGQRRDNRKAR